MKSNSIVHGNFIKKCRINEAPSRVAKKQAMQRCINVKTILKFIRKG
ncbi:MAG: hypothetical protein HUU54_02645 [Ignavibacteriaceae bacterium]|nr:hypothetical protein [Ignavibacteriaceae bacterium]